ncbi:nucleotide exchange factor GrpE [Bifidobacterium thermacidophilum]|uniref:Protein GrpE n=1 Tax=Bifidobacterium thermacidophilum subsp. thermacidophilum TaxID=79262 RepID=A0A087EAM8_9BIFI|nr:nucleotide exchange factor GrpE [Bifidobacterium thermacidophilum]KFJ04829.1 heat shock protein GrpE [Bifidobacterium thermacidophilum subsp. thermacidophilum]
MSDFNKDDYLKDLPDVDSLGGEGASGQAGGSHEQNASASAGGQSAGAGSAADQSHEQASDTAKAGSAASSDAKSAADEDGKKQAAQHAQDNAQHASAGAADNGKDGDADHDKDGSLTPLGQAKKEAAEYLEALQRERAEFINYRNRMDKEREQSRQYGIVDVLTSLLPALDDIDRIREHGQMDDSFKAVATKIDKTFAKFGVEKFGEKGEDFDPTKHEAVLQKPDPEAKKETVDTVVEAGYRIGDRVVRAARVVVSMPQN